MNTSRSAQPNYDNAEALFSLELLVECVRFDREAASRHVSDELAVGMRLLDFPTLLICRPPRGSGSTQTERRGECAFNRGKSCFFKMNMNSLQAQLSSSPLYAMVLDVKEETPKLVGTSLISLANVVGRIRRDVTSRGAAAPSSHGERGLVALSNLMGEKIGSISLSYKLQSLGASAQPLVRGSSSTSVDGEQHAQAPGGVEQENVSPALTPLERGNASSPTLTPSDVSGKNPNKKPSNGNKWMPEDRRGRDVCAAVQTEHKPRTQIPRVCRNQSSFEEDLTIFCPPCLFYCNSAEEKGKREGEHCKVQNTVSDDVAFEDSNSDEETSESQFECMNSPLMSQTVRHDVKRNQQTNGVTPNVLGDALQQLPLLNALLVELSQLCGQNPHQPPSVHANLARIYRPASPEPSAGKVQANSMQRSQQVACPHLKCLHPTRNCSTPVVRTSPAKVSDKQEEALIKSPSPRKKLMYGTTKTFHLRLKQVSSRGVKRRECMALMQNETRTNVVMGKTKASNKVMKSSQRKSAVSQSVSLNEDIETMTQNVTVDCALQETITLKQKSPNEKVHGKGNRYPPRISDKRSLSERDMKVSPVPSIDGASAGKNKDKNERHSKSSQSESQSDIIHSSGSSRPSSRTSSLSGSSREGQETADYSDDFNSPEPGDAYSPEPVSSPEPSRSRTPRSPAHPNLSNPDSGSEVFPRRAALPQPIKASMSPQRSLRATHIIRPGTRASALSFSSADSDSDGSASLHTARSRKQTESGMGRNCDSSSTGQHSESTKNSSPQQGFLEESISSFETEDLEDALGSLDFRREYRHISKPVGSKPLGHTV